MTSVIPPVRRLWAAALAVAFAALCLAPCWLRLRNPTLYADDVVRIVHLQTHPLGELLFRPFNEHMAPLFEVITWTAWNLAGRRVASAPLVLVIASSVAFAATLGMLWLVIRRELGSSATALAAVAVFGLASHDGEVVNWYSASSFTWAAAAFLVAWLGSAEASRARSRRRVVGWLFLSALGALAAPSFSAIGLLAGPLAVIRLMADDTATRHRRWLGTLFPMAGMLAYLATCEWFRYRDVLASGLGRNVGLSTALWNLGRAPVDVLVPGLVGVRNLDRMLPDRLELAISVASAIALLAWACTSPRRRPLILGGLALIAGGYGVTYGVRTLPDPRQVLNVQRYHLFPHLGLILLLAPALRAGLRRLEGRPITSLFAVNALAMTLLWAHLPQIKEHLRFFRFPDQPPTLAALDRLDASCRRQGITRDQVLSALDPIRPSWVPWDGNALEMLPPSVRVAGRDDSGTRLALLSALSPGDREAVCGGMDASAHRVPSPTMEGSRAPALARLVAWSRVEPAGPGRFTSKGWPAYLEYQLGPDADDAQALALADVRTGRNLELWWADVDGKWSPNRSAWWRPAPDQDWAVPLDRLPHWQRGHVRRLRVYFHEPGAVALSHPKLLR